MEQEQASQIPRSTRDVKQTSIIIGSGEKARKFDLTRIQPFSLGDRRALLKAGLNLGNLSEFGPEQDVVLLQRIFTRAGFEITEAEMDELASPVVQDIILYALHKTNEVDRPFSSRSTSSQDTTDGAAGK